MSDVLGMVAAVRSVRRRAAPRVMLASLMTEFFAIAMRFTAIMMPLAQVVAQLAQVLLEIGLILGGIGRIGLHVLEVLANRRPILTNVMSIVVEVVARLFVLVPSVTFVVLVPCVAFDVFAARVRQGEDLHVVELSMQLVFFVPDLVTLLGDVLEVVQDGLLVGSRVARVRFPIGQILTNVCLVLTDLAAIALDALQVASGRSGVVAEVTRSAARR